MSQIGSKSLFLSTNIILSLLIRFVKLMKTEEKNLVKELNNTFIGSKEFSMKPPEQKKNKKYSLTNLV